MLNSQLLLEVARINNFNKKYQTIWVAYSGGVDSHVLLDLARQAFSNVRAVHIDHGLHTDDVLWQKHCIKICTQLNIPLDCIKVDATAKPGQSSEEAARNARRRACKSLLSADDLLLMAHHADDQAETILYRLMRGTGPRGLSGIRPYSKVGAADLFRPFLNVSKQEILSYAQLHNLNWIEDRSNKKNAFDRNYLRNAIMPLLQTRWPKAVKNINRAGELCAQMSQEIEPQVQAKLTNMLAAEDTINITLLKQQTPYLQQELLRAWLKIHDLIPSMQQIKLLQQQIIDARIDAMPQLHVGNQIIKRNKNLLYVLESKTSTNPEFSSNWNLSQALQLPNGQSLQAENIFKDKVLLAMLAEQQVTVRLGVIGRKAKKIFQQHAIPPWERTQYPLVFANNNLVGIVGLWIKERVACL